MSACPHGFDNPASCLDCMDEGNLPVPPPPPVAKPVSPPILARFPGHCQGCDEPIEVGQSIARWNDDSWRHHPHCP